MKTQKKRFLSCLLVLTMVTALFAGCGSMQKQSLKQNPELDTSETIHLKITGGLKNFKALETVGQQFTKLYPNCTIEYEYLQDYQETLMKRLDSEEDKPDLFITSNITADSERKAYALELNAHADELDLSETFDGLLKNFTILETNELYAVPLHAEVRGMYVNTTLLAKNGLEIPTNRTELLEACRVLYANGYLPLQANPGSFGQLLIYSYIASSIANAEDYEAVYDRVNRIEEGVEELFRDPLEFLYLLVEEGYYDYKRGQDEYGYFTDSTAENMALCFLQVLDTQVGGVPEDPEGIVPFMTAPISTQSVMAKTKEDYHSNIEYEFILAPIADEGAYAYLSPGDGIAINRNSDHTEWALEFMNFLFMEENNKLFAQEYGVIPNTSDAIAYVSEEFDIPTDQICQLGDVTFDYHLYAIINAVATQISKGNNPKYMQEDAEGNLSLYEFEYYMEQLRNSFQEQREGNGA